MSGERRLVLLGSIGVAMTFAAGVSDFVTGGFWERHALFASLVANLLVVAVTVVVVNEVLERRGRRRWNLLAQSVMFALLQSARATWTGLVEVLELGEVHSGAIELLLDSAKLARDLPRVSAAIHELLAVPERRVRLLGLCFGLSEHASEVIAKWAPVMVSTGPYAAVLDRHVELAERLGWLSNVLAHVEEPPARSQRERRLVQSSVAAERANELGNDEWLHDQILTVITLATELDYEAREQALALVPMSWWAERTTGLGQ
jgi:hypothetical protein